MLSPTAQTRLLLLAQAYLRKLGTREANGIGVAANFYRVSETMGVKIFRGGGMGYAKDIFERQKQAYNMGLGPYCFGLQIFQCYNSLGQEVNRWGYITEIVVVHTDAVGETYMQEHMNEMPQIRHMRRLFDNRMGFVFNDCHNHNVGCRGRKLLCIDFGDE